MSSRHSHSNRFSQTASTIVAGLAAVTVLNSAVATPAINLGTVAVAAPTPGEPYVWMLEQELGFDIDGDGIIGPPPLPPPGGGGGGRTV